MITTHITHDEFMVIKRAEEISKKDASELQLIVPDNINDGWGVYKIHRVYTLPFDAYKFFAVMELLEDASSQYDAQARAIAFKAIAADAENGKNKCDLCRKQEPLHYKSRVEYWLCRSCYNHVSERMESFNVADTI